MTTSIVPLTKCAAWKALEAHYSKVREVHLRKLFADDSKRGERMTVVAFTFFGRWPSAGKDMTSA